MPSLLTRDLPPGLTLEAVLADSNRGCVLRVQRGSQKLVLRIHREASRTVSAQAAVAAGLSDPGLVAPTEWGLTPAGRPYILRHWLDGVPFDVAAREADADQVVGWVRALLATLSTLHGAGLVHRDVKAANVLVVDGRVRLIDLDLLAESGAAGAGSRLHLAPELLLGRPHEPSADLFALGAMVALARLGEPSPDFHRHFPGRSFWAASGLDPGRLDPALAGLVRALVRRHPLDRPPSAVAAARLLRDGGAAPPPDLSLPFFEGRAAARDEIRERLLASDTVRMVLLVVEDPEDEQVLLDHLELTLSMQSRRVRRLGPDALQPGPAPEAPSEAPDVVLLAGSALPAGADATGIALASLLRTRTRAPRLLLALRAEAADALGAELARRLDGVAPAVVRIDWPRVPVTALEQHLLRLSEGASPEVAAELARELHRRTTGRFADVNRLLRSAERAGVLRCEGGRFVPLRTDWPEGLEAEPLRLEQVRQLPPDGRQLLLAVACLDGPASERALADVAQLSAEAAAAGRLCLQAQGLLSAGGRLIDPRWAAAARAVVDEREWIDWHRRCAEVLAREGEPAGRVARHRLAGARTEAELERGLHVAQAELSAGRLTESRALVQILAGRLGADGSPLRQRLVELTARLDLAQGRADDALATLRTLHGDELADAPAPLLLVAAHALEQSGRRGEARSMFGRALARSLDRADRLRALTGLGYGHFLDGDWQAALDVIGTEPAEDDPDEPAAALLNLRGVTLTRLGRHDEAAAALVRALARATRSGDPLVRARAELNLAHLDRRRARPAAAAAGLQRAIAAFAEAGHVQGRALALNNLGVLQRDLGDLRRAAALLEEALDLRWRVGDAHGAASSLGSLALVELDAGQIGAALASLKRARELMARGDYEAELRLVDRACAIALALAGRQAEAASRLHSIRAPGAPDARDEHAALGSRAEALVAFTAGDRERALAATRAAQEQASTAGDLAEGFRATALLAALRPGDVRVAAELAELAERLESPVRRAEAALRTLSAPEAIALESWAAWLDLFEAAGRTDLVMTVARGLARRLGDAGDLAGSRRALARASQAVDALADGLPNPEKDATVQRLSRLIGSATANAAARGGLSVDWFLACNRRMASEADLPGLLSAIVDMALELTGARHGFLVLMEGERVDMQVARGLDETSMPAEEVHFSRTVVREAVASGGPVLTTDAAHDPRFHGTESISSLQLRSVLCVPLPLSSPLSGALYLDNEQGEPPFDEPDAVAAASLADQAAVAIVSLRRRAEIETLNRRLSDRVAVQQDELQRARQLLRRRGAVAPVGGLVGDSAAMQRVYALIDRLAPTSLPVVVTGPTGVGKDLVARALHARSRRADGPLVVENVSALPASLLESELFGHVRGAFTGADRDRSGLFVEADGGTFFLDEIGDMPVELQAKLLRVLESGELRPLGARKPVRVDVRIIAATNRDLHERMRAGAFREDLYYRLNAAEIRVPPLEERLEDIPLLARHLLALLNAKHGTTKAFDERVVQALAARPWPGQVRELSNEVARLYFLSEGVIDDPGLLRASPASAVRAAAAGATEPMPASMKLADLERAAVLRALRAAGHRKDKAASLLGISRAGLYAKLKRLGQD